MYNNLRINRRYLKSDARANFFKHKNPCFTYGIILVAAELLYSLLRDHFLPIFSPDIPEGVMTSTEAMTRWMQSYINNTLPSMVTRNNIIIAVLLLVIGVMVFVPLRFGGYEIAMKLSSGGEASLKTLGGWFLNGTRLIRSIGLTLLVYIKALLWGIVYFIVPTALLVGGGLLLESQFFLAEALITLGYVTSVAAGILIGAKYSRYTIAFYILAEKEENTVFQSFRDAMALTKGRALEVFILYLSFILWELLNSFTYGVISIYLTSYINLTVSGFIYNVRAVNSGADLSSEQSEE